MRGFRFLHAADLHLDSPFRGLSEVPRPIREVIRGSTLSALDRLTELAIRERVNFVVIVGDVYDLEDRSVRAQLRFQRAAERLAEAGIGVYIAHGNHDPLDGKQLPWEPPAGVKVFPAGEVETAVVRDPSGREIAHVHGISYGTAQVTENLAERFRVHNRSVFNIGVLHTNVDGARDHANYAPSSRAALIGKGMDYWALGHIHARSVLHEVPYIVYPGNLQSRSMKETGPKGCYIVDVDEDHAVQLRFHAADSVRWFELSVNLEEAADEQQIKERIEQQLAELQAQTDGRPAVVRLILTGRTELHSVLTQTAFLDDVIADWNEREVQLCEQQAGSCFVWIEGCRVRTSGLIDREYWLEQEHFVGDLLRTAAELRRDETALRQYAEELLTDLLRSKAGRYLRDHGSRSGGNFLTAQEPDELVECLEQAEEWLLDKLLGGEAG